MNSSATHDIIQLRKELDIIRRIMEIYGEHVDKQVMPQNVQASIAARYICSKICGVT
jgi:hypothetical protein